MPIAYDIDRHRGLVTTRLWGAVTDDEVYEFNDRLRSDPDFDPAYRQIADMTGVTEIRVSTSMINETARDQIFTPGTRRAFIASDDGVFGMARMYSLRAEGFGQTIEVFREVAPAEEWVDA